MKKKFWKKVTPRVWVCDDWAVEDGDGYTMLFHNGELRWTYKSPEQAKRAATQATLDKAASERAKLRAKTPGMVKLKENSR